MWCHTRGAALTLVLALACLSAVRALSSDVLAVGDLAASANGKRFPVVGTPRTFPGPTVTDPVRLGTLRERAFPSRADAAGAPGAGADAFPADAGGQAAREDAGGRAESVVANSTMPHPFDLPSGSLSISQLMTVPQADMCSLRLAESTLHERLPTKRRFVDVETVWEDLAVRLVGWGRGAARVRWFGGLGDSQ